MKSRTVLYILGLLTMLIGVMMLIPGIVSAMYKEPLSIVAFGLTSAVTLVSGMTMKYLGRGQNNGDKIEPKEAFAAVSIGWILAAFFGSLPFIFLGMGPLDAVFESMSGFTTAGATMLTEFNSQGYWVLNQERVENSVAYFIVENATKVVLGDASSGGLLSTLHFLDLKQYLSVKGTFYGLLFWRSFSQFLGGMGIILLFIAILPYAGVAGRQLYSVEASGLVKEPITPRVKDTAKTFWSIYLGMAGLEALFLILLKVPAYDSICIAFASIATGGFSPRAYSIAEYNSLMVEAVVCIFLILGGTNFALHYRALRQRKIRALTDDSEFRFYISIMALAISILLLWGTIGSSPTNQLRFSAFQVVSTMTTTGFVNTFSYDAWSIAAKLTLIILMLIGGCTGSTGGGIKVGRVLLVLKYTYNELTHALHPRAIIPIRLGKTVVKEEVIRSVLLFMLLYLMIFLGACLSFAITESGDPQFNAISAISAAACTLGVVGPGFGAVAMDFSSVSQAGKVLGLVCMYVGRLEIIPALTLIMPELWKK
jgi:trk system potassium uptake protein TrkH